MVACASKIELDGVSQQKGCMSMDGARFVQYYKDGILYEALQEYFAGYGWRTVYEEKIG